MIHVFHYYTYKKKTALISVNPENLLDAETFMCGSILNVTFAISQERKSGRGVLASLGLNAERDTVANEDGQNVGVSTHWARMNPKKYEC